MPTQLLGADGPPVSRIALGCMGLTGTWNPADMTETHVHRAVAVFEAAMEVGITFYDHADIYGGGTCEDVFKDCLRAVPGSRERIVIATKCGIRQGHYNLSYAYIQEAIDRSLKRLGVEYIDLYQLHRPDPFTHASETARALNELVRQGKVRTIGVSNYYPEQVRALQRYLDMPIRSNQFQVSLRHLPPIYDDGTLDQCEALQMTPLAYSPLGGGVLSGKHEQGEDKVLTGLLAELKSQSETYNADAGAGRDRMAAGASSADRTASRKREPCPYLRVRGCNQCKPVSRGLVQALGCRPRAACSLKLD